MKNIFKTFGLLLAGLSISLALTACDNGEHTHTPVKIDEKAATCTAEGNAEYYGCSGCDKLFADAELKTETTAEAQKLPIIAHTPAADDGDCTTAVKCVNCNGIVIEAKAAHTPGTDDGDCTTALGCAYCQKIVKYGEAAHTDEGLDGKCDICESDIDCVKDENGVYYVFTAEGLYEWAFTHEADGDLVLMSDITLPDEKIYDADYDDVPDGNWSPLYLRVNVDGRGHVITGLRIEISTTLGIGLFENIVENVTVKNLRLEDVKLEGKGRAGGIAANSSGTVINCSVSGSIHSTANSVGGIVGYCGGSIIACYNEAEVSADEGCVGGIVGQVNGENFIGCYNIGRVVSANFAVGGVFGNFYNGNAIACYSVADLEGTGEVGGIVVYAPSNVTFDAVYWIVTNQATESGNCQNPNTAGIFEVDGVTVGWADAILAMNAALVSSGCDFRFAENTGADASVRPFVLVAATE